MAIVSTQRIADKRRLPIEKVSEYAIAICGALWQDGDSTDGVSEICHEWLAEIGFDPDAGMVFEFAPEKKYLDGDIGITCTFGDVVVKYSLGSITAPMVRKGEDIDEAILDCGIGILASLDAVVLLAIRKLITEMFFNKRDPDFRYQDALYSLGTKTI